MDGHLVYSHSSVVVNDAAVNVHWSYLFQIRILFPLDIYPEVGLLDDMVVLFLIFEESNTVFHNGHTILCFHQSAQFSSVTQSCPTLCNPMNCSTPGLPVHHQLPESTQTHVHWVGDAIQPSHPLSSPSPLTLNVEKHQGLFKWVSSSHQVAKVLEFQLQYQFFQWTPRTDLL